MGPSTAKAHAPQHGPGILKAGKQGKVDASVAAAKDGKGEAMQVLQRCIRKVVKARLVLDTHGLRHQRVLFLIHHLTGRMHGTNTALKNPCYSMFSSMNS